MKAKRILVPIDVTKCPIDIFERVNAYARQPGTTVILLYVVDLNVACPENRIYDELVREAQMHLERLAHDYLHPAASVLIRVRMGRPAREIKDEARTQKADLVILPVFAQTMDRAGAFGRRLLPLLWPDTAHQLVRALPSALLIMHADSRFDCFEHWTHPNAQSEIV